MSDIKAPWLKPLGLKENEFSQMPTGEDAALWGLKNQVIPELKFSQWVSETYKIPTINPDFFNMPLDFSLLEKFAHLHEWSDHCFPIYLWKDVLFIACLSPEQISMDQQKCCLVAAPYSTMKAAWVRHDTEADKSISVPTPEPELVITQPPPSVPANVANTDTPPPAAEIESLGELDFSSLDEMGQTPQAPQATPQDEPELTRTRVDDTPMNNLTTATQTVQKHSGERTATPDDLPFPELDFGDISIENISLEGDVQNLKSQPAPEPSPAEQMGKRPLAPPVEETSSDEDSHVEDSQVEDSNVRLSQNEAEDEDKDADFDDDYTPVPFISQEDKELFRHTNVGMSHIKKPDGPIENTLTDHGSKPENHAAIENLVTESDMNRCLDLKSCQTKKDVISHIFRHLKRDYRKLMWMEIREDGHCYPTYIFGNWAMTIEAWNTPVNLLKPNIFRIASLSDLPFHGEVAKNEINTGYFQLWTSGKVPDVATIYPVSDEDQLKGFVVAFSINEEFDEVGSLSKIQKLVSLTSKHMFQSKLKKSA